MTAEQIDSLVAPIALYPDELVSQILVASTYPLEVVQAQQWLQQHSNLKGQDLTTAAQKQPWDPSIQALVAFPDVLKRLNQDVTWTTNLGNAFLANQAQVMDQVQIMRQKAEAAGKLKSTPQRNREKYNGGGASCRRDRTCQPRCRLMFRIMTRLGSGAPRRPYYPYPYWYYPAAPLYGGWCWCGPQHLYEWSTFFLLALGWMGRLGLACWLVWQRHLLQSGILCGTVNHFNSAHFADVHGVAVWQHNPTHRMGVSPIRTGHCLNSFHAASRPGVARVSVAQARDQFRAAGARVSSDRFGKCVRLDPASF